MNVGMMACYDQAKEVVATLLGDPMTNGPGLPTQVGASCVAVRVHGLLHWPLDSFLVFCTDAFLSFAFFTSISLVSLT